MIPKIPLLGSVLLISTIAFCQSPDQLLDRWSSRTPIEKVYLHFDRENYIAGETIWFKAYTWSDYLPDTISTSLYVELIHSNGQPVAKSILPVLLGTASGHLEIPDSLPAGSYVVRSFSPTMLNIDPAFIGKQSVFIYGKKRTQSPPMDKKVRIEFFPEGGNLVNGVTNSIAFKVTDENGYPVSTIGMLFNEKNEMITEFSTYHDGMGMFEFSPVPGMKYYAVADQDERAGHQYLPAAVSKGIAITLMSHPQGQFLEIRQNASDPEFSVAYMVGQMQHHVVFRQPFPAAKNEMQSVINTQNLHSGILQITFFNKNNQPLGERLCFVRNKELIQDGELLADTVDFNAKGKNSFSLVMKDTVQGNFSVSVTDADYSFGDRKENIVSHFLLSSDLKGFIHNPGWYFIPDKDSTEIALDLLMMTHGWRRFKWTELEQKIYQTPVYKDPSYITLSGKINLRDTKKPFANKSLLLMLITADSSRSIQMINTDKQGNFKLDSMLFFGPSQLFFSDIRGKKNQYIDVRLSEDSLTKSFLIPVIPQQPIKGESLTAVSYGSKIDLDYDAIKNAKGLMLEGVTVKARKKTPVEELEEKYVSGMFAGEDHKVFDLVNTKETETYANIFDYLQSRVPGLSILEPDYQDYMPMYQLFYRQAANVTVSSLGPIPMTLYLNEVETSAMVIATLQASDIAMVKLFSHLAGATGSGAGGVLAIYTKKGSDLADKMQSTSDIVQYNGYTIAKEFYAPDYSSLKSPKKEADTRITLEWISDIRVNNVNPRIPITFYNNDRTKSFKVVVEGMTLDGKLLMIEKVISNR